MRIADSLRSLPQLHTSSRGSEPYTSAWAVCSPDHLNLNGNLIEAAGLARLAGVLGQFSALSFLDLGTNNLEYAGAKILAGLLAQCTALTHLSLEDNRIGAAGAARIVQVLAQRPPLVSLDFSLNGLGADMKRRLAAEWSGEADDLVLENDGWSDGDEEEEEEG